ncbi:MAG: DUF1573 domain-containing protein [Armatimonadetes bacterium]|nr:DUF1573 domain-containing protein [Armatimonadota bacterium]
MGQSRRVRALVVAAGLLVAGLLVVGGAAWAVWIYTARPAIALDPITLDFGHLSAPMVKTRTVVVRNIGRAPLRIEAISSSCGCTTGKMDATVISAGRAAQMRVAFDTVAHGPQTGPARHAVYLRTNDPRNPEVEIEVRAVVLKGGSP